MGVGSRFWVLHLSGAGWSRLPWGVLPAALGVTIPDGPASAGSQSTGGTEVKVVLFSTPAMGASFSSCPMLELMGSKNSSYVGSGCALPCPWGIPHKLVHQDMATFPQHIPYSPIFNGFCDGPWRQLHRLGLCLQPPRLLLCFICHNFFLWHWASLAWKASAFFWAHLVHSLIFVQILSCLVLLLWAVLNQV